MDAAEQQPAGYYRAASARARRLQDEATTPKIKEYLRELIERYDRLAKGGDIQLADLAWFEGVRQSQPSRLADVPG